MKPKCRVPIVLSVVLLSICGVTVVRVGQAVADTPPTSKGSYADFLIEEAPPTALPTTQAKYDRDEFQRYKGNLATLVKSQFVIAKALGNSDVRDLPLVKQHGADAADWLAEQIVVKFPGDGSLMKIGIINSDQRQSSIIVQAVADAVMTEIVDKERMGRNKRLAELDRIYTEREIELRERRTVLKTLCEEQRDNHKEELTDRLHRLEQLATESDRAEIQAELQIARGKHKLEGLADSSPDYKAMKSEIDLAEVDRKFWSEKSASESRQISETAKQMAHANVPSIDVEMVRAELGELESTFNAVGKEREKCRDELNAIPRVSMVSRAHSE